MPVPTTGAAVERSANANARKTIHELARYLTRPLYSFSPPCQDQRCCETLAVCWCHREGQKKSHYRCGLAVSFLLPVNRASPIEIPNARPCLHAGTMLFENKSQAPLKPGFF